MKNFHAKSLLLVAGMGLSASTRSVEAGPFDESKGPAFYKLSKPIAKRLPPLGVMAADDYIITLSQASNINFIADATHISTQDWVQPYPSNPTAKRWKQYAGGVPFYNLLADFEFDRKLSELRYDESTYLLWDKPDATKTARLLIAAGQHRPGEALPDEFALFQAIEDYSKRPLDWRRRVGSNERPYHKTQLGTLPPELRAQIKALAKHEILRPDLRRELLFTDDYWKTARIRFSSEQRPGPGGAVRTFSIVLINGQDENGQPLPAFQLSDFSDRNFHFTSGITTQAVGPLTQSVYDRSSVMREAGKPRTASPDALPPLPTAPQLAALETVVPLGLSGAELEMETALQAKVSLEAKRRPLGELLAQAVAKKGVTLVIGEGVPAKTALVTARVSEMPGHSDGRLSAGLRPLLDKRRCR